LRHTAATLFLEKGGDIRHLQMILGHADMRMVMRYTHLSTNSIASQHEQYTSFDSVQELNYHVKQHTNMRVRNMNETQRNLLQLISQYSVKYLGASHFKINTIASIMNVSRRTIERSLKVLERLKIIERINTNRPKSGGKGSNIYRILPS